MARQEVDNGDQGLVARTKINENFEELYSAHGEVLTGTATTIGNSTETAITIPIPLDTSVTVFFKVDGKAQTNDDRLVSVYLAAFKNISGVVSVIDAAIDEMGRQSDNVQVTGDRDVSGTDGLIQVTGSATEDWDFDVSAQVRTV